LGEKLSGFTALPGLLLHTKMTAFYPPTPPKVEPKIGLNSWLKVTWRACRGVGPKILLDMSRLILYIIIIKKKKTNFFLLLWPLYWIQREYGVIWAIGLRAVSSNEETVRSPYRRDKEKRVTEQKYRDGGMIGDSK
jgi:hypothetical protein